MDMEVAHSKETAGRARVPRDVSGSARATRRVREGTGVTLGAAWGSTKERACVHGCTRDQATD